MQIAIAKTQSFVTKIQSPFGYKTSQQAIATALRRVSLRFMLGELRQKSRKERQNSGVEPDLGNVLLLRRP
jgi:hypothetical protein